MLLKVASYNIHKAVGTDGQYSPERILAVIAAIDADVIMLQEADKRFGSRRSVLPLAMIAARTPYRPVALGHNPASLGWHGNAALVSERVTVTAAVRLDLPSLEPRGAILVETLIDGHTVRFGSMHLDLSGLRRRQQARCVHAHVLARPAPMATILMGDLNEWRPTGGCLADFARDYAFAATGPSFPARLPLARLDRLMAGPSIEIIAADTHRHGAAKIASDHLPIWATVRIQPERDVIGKAGRGVETGPS